MLDQAKAPVEDVAFDAAERDIVASLTKLCFTPHMHLVPVVECDDIVTESHALLQREEATNTGILGMDTTASDGIDLSQADLLDLLDLLPPGEELRSLIQWDQSAGSFAHTSDLVYSPQTFALLERFCAPDRVARSDLLDAPLLAEVHAYIATGTLERFHGTMVTIHASQEAQDHAWMLQQGPAGWHSPFGTERPTRTAILHAEAAKRALELTDHLCQPNLPIVRAHASLARLAIPQSLRATALTSYRLYSYTFPSTEYISTGAVYAQLGLSLADALDLTNEDPEIRRTETTLDRYNRRAVVSALFRMQGTIPGLMGRPSLVSAAALAVPPPDHLEEADLPIELRGQHRPGPDVL
jgi:hypothetical protein